MRIICDTPIPLLWAHAPSRLSVSAAAALENGRQESQLAIADISLWQLALLIDHRGHGTSRWLAIDHR
jgi:PIN domain nuclease of toxin-antitoxin system